MCCIHLHTFAHNDDDDSSAIMHFSIDYNLFLCQSSNIAMMRLLSGTWRETCKALVCLVILLESLFCFHCVGECDTIIIALIRFSFSSLHYMSETAPLMCFRDMMMGLCASPCMKSVGALSPNVQFKFMWALSHQMSWCYTIL